MSFSIEEFMSNTMDFSRSYLFEWIPFWPSGITGGFGDKYLVRSTTLPESSVEQISIEYQQIDYKMAIKRTFTDWTVSLYLDKDGSVRWKFEEWINKINKVYENSNNKFENGIKGNYRTNQEFYLLDNNAEQRLSINMYNVWPRSVGQISLDYGSQEFAHFDVTFSYDWHRVNKPTEGSPVDFSIAQMISALSSGLSKITGNIG